LRHNCVINQPLLAQGSEVKGFVNSLEEVLRVGGLLKHLEMGIANSTAMWNSWIIDF
jgi:hypothetical protein